MKRKSKNQLCAPAALSFCFVPMILLLPGVFGLQGILFAQPAADVLAAVITVFMAWDVHRKLWDIDKA